MPYSIQIKGFQEHRLIHSIMKMISTEGIRIVNPKPTHMGKCGILLRCFANCAAAARVATAPSVIVVRIMGCC